MLSPVRARSRARKILIPALESALIFSAPGSSRASSIATFDDGARRGVPATDIAVEPREAQRPLSLAARTPQAATPGNRESPWVRSNGPSQGPCGASQAPGAVASRAYPTCASTCRSRLKPRSGALHPLVSRGKGKQGYGPSRGARIQSLRAAELWLSMSIRVFLAPLRVAHPIRYIRAIGMPKVNARLTRFRHPGTADDEGFFGNVAALHHSRDRSGGRQGPAGCCPHSRRAPAAYLPLRAGWALAPGHSGDRADSQEHQGAPKRAQCEKDPFHDHVSEVREGPRRHL